MPDNISRKRLKKKVLDRWENEGGKILADQTGNSKSGSPDRSPGKDNAGPTSEKAALERPKRQKLRNSME